MPSLLLVFDKGTRIPFYLRIENLHGVEIVHLRGVASLPEAVKTATKLGYYPRHWVEAGHNPSLIPSSIRPKREFQAGQEDWPGQISDAQRVWANKMGKEPEPSDADAPTLDIDLYIDDELVHGGAVRVHTTIEDRDLIIAALNKAEEGRG